MVRRPSKSRRWRRLVVIATVLAAGGWMLFGWRVQTVEVSGTTLTSPGAIRDAVLARLQRSTWMGFTPQSYMLLMHPGRIADELEQEFNLANVAIHRQMNGTLRVATTEQTIAAILMPNGGAPYLIGATGLLIGPAPDFVTATKTVNTIIVRTPLANAATGVRVLAPEAMSVLREIWSALARLDGSLRPSYAGPRQDSPSTVDVTTASGAVIIITTLEALEPQLEKLQILLSSRPTESERAKLRSIDLRYGDRVYVQ